MFKLSDGMMIKMVVFLGFVEFLGGLFNKFFEFDVFFGGLGNICFVDMDCVLMYFCDNMVGLGFLSLINECKLKKVDGELCLKVGVCIVNYC